MTDTVWRNGCGPANGPTANIPLPGTDDQEGEHIHAIEGRLWVDTCCQGEWGSRPIGEAIADGERQREAARARLAEADRCREARLLPLRVARMVGDWNTAVALQRDVDRAERAAHEARDAIVRQNGRLAIFEQARHDHLRPPRPRQNRNPRQIDMLAALDTWDALDATDERQPT